jgi:hypothetical protein
MRFSPSGSTSAGRGARRSARFLCPWRLGRRPVAAPISHSRELVAGAALRRDGLGPAAARHPRTVYRWGTWNAALNWATWLALFFLALQIFQRSAARHWFSALRAVFRIRAGVLSTVQMFTSGGKIFWLFPSGYTDYVMGPFVYRNQYAAFLEMILPIALWQALRDRRRAFANCAMAAAMLASVVAAASRAGSVLMCAEVAVVAGGLVARHGAGRNVWPAGWPRSSPWPCYSPPLPVGRRCGSASCSRIRSPDGASSWSPRWPCCTTGPAWVSDWGTGRAPIRIRALRRRHLREPGA